MGRTLIKIAQSKHFPQILLLLILLVMGVVLSFLSPYFLTWSNFYNILDQTSVDIILAIGMAFVIASGGIDLSIGSVLAYSGIIMAFAMKAGIPVPLAVALGILAGVIIGLCSGLLISRLLNPLVTTQHMSIARGLALIHKIISIWFNAFKFIGSGRVGPVNVLLSLLWLL